MMHETVNTIPSPVSPGNSSYGKDYALAGASGSSGLSKSARILCRLTLAGPFKARGLCSPRSPSRSDG
jgi:hypothetical protein